MTLCNWYREYLENGHGFPDANPYERYDAERKRAAVDRFFEHGRCLARTCRLLGYPSKGLRARWIDEFEPGRRPRGNSTAKIPEEVKGRAVVDLITKEGAAKDIADELGVERATLHNWKRRLLSGEVPCKLPKKTDARTIGELEDHAARLRSDIDRLELQKAILEGTVELLGKDRSVDPRMLTNREKTTLVENLRQAHRLNVLLDAVGMPKSSCLYQKRAIARPDKHSCLRIRITEIFHENDGRCGYRRIHAVLKSEDIAVSEKVVCRIMKEGRLVAKRPMKRKCGTYKGEIGEAPDNIVKRDFSAEAPNTL